MKSYFDIAGDGGSRILEQVAEQRERIARRLSRVRWMMAVGSGKGGVGKSTLTMQLACALRDRDLEVAILDADVNGPAQARLAGLRDTPLVPGSDGLSVPRSRAGVGVVSLGSLFPEPEWVDFESVASGETQTWRATREFSALGELVRAVDWGRLDLLLVDLPPGAERTLQFAEFLGPQTPFALVTIPSELSRGVVTRSISALRNTPNRLLGYIENMKGYYCRDCDAVRPLFPAGERVDLGIPCLGEVPFDPDLAELCDRGGSLQEQPQRASAAAVRNVASRLLEVLETDA